MSPANTVRVRRYIREMENSSSRALSLMPEEGEPHKLDNIFAALHMLAALKKQRKKYHFGGLIYFSPKYDRKLQDSEFDRLTHAFSANHLDCVQADEKEMIKYFEKKKLTVQGPAQH